MIVRGFVRRNRTGPMAASCCWLSAVLSAGGLSLLMSICVTYGMVAIELRLNLDRSPLFGVTVAPNMGVFEGVCACWRFEKRC